MKVGYAEFISLIFRTEYVQKLTKLLKYLQMLMSLHQYVWMPSQF